VQDLHTANLTHADLHGAVLIADLAEADLTEADLNGVVFTEKKDQDLRHLAWPSPDE
jgi:uncharacterized protein YjbI with pentapeptide repeats